MFVQRTMRSESAQTTQNGGQTHAKCTMETVKSQNGKMSKCQNVKMRMVMTGHRQRGHASGNIINLNLSINCIKLQTLSIRNATVRSSKTEKIKKQKYKIMDWVAQHFYFWFVWFPGNIP